VSDPLHITSTKMPKAKFRPFSTALRVEGGSDPYKWTSSDLPSWLRLSEEGRLSGTPTDPGSPTFTVKVTDSDDRSSEEQLLISVTTHSSWLMNTSLWLGILSWVLPLAGLAGIFLYAWAAPSGTSSVSTSYPTRPPDWNGVQIAWCRVDGNPVHAVV
jgi:hypothetical protein